MPEKAVPEIDCRRSRIERAATGFDILPPPPTRPFGGAHRKEEDNPRAAAGGGRRPLGAPRRTERDPEDFS
jgi:hypothetical protein